MASQFHNRLVGVTILVASVVIFLPSIIDGKKIAYEEEFVATPIKPAIKEHSAVTQQAASEQKAASAATQADSNTEVVENSHWEIQEVTQTVTAPATENSTKAAEPGATKKVVVPESAWAIQLGAFQNAQNINVLLKKLHKAGYQAHTVPTEVIDGQLTRVFVGPDVSKKKLENQLPQLKRLTKLQGKLLPFDAVKP